MRDVLDGEAVIQRTILHVILEKVGGEVCD